VTSNSWFRKLRAPISIAVLAPAAVGAAFSPLNFPISSWAQFGFHSAGWLIFFAGAACRWWATLYVGGRKSAELVTVGPYSITRNPVYVGTLLLTLSVAAFSQSAVFLLGVVVAAIVYLGLTIPVEENGLRARHGERFEAYCRQAPVFFPRFGRFHSPETIQVHTSGLRIEVVRMARWIWIPILCDLATHLRAMEWWPKLFNLP
jgi:protein-S-isoprenylcysteine O-methyltransferase Ste14